MAGIGPKNILVVDDTLFFRVKISDILTEAGHAVTGVSDGNEAVEALKANIDNIDLVLLDLEMPGLDGFGVLQWIKDNGLGAKVAVLALTGAYPATEVTQRLRELGAKGLITKEASPDDILQRVDATLSMP